MKLSLRTIELCRMKFGKGIFKGFELNPVYNISSLSEEDVQKDFDILLNNEILEVNDRVQIIALGQHIFNMMVAPEQFIYIDNEIKKIHTRVYLKIAFYLCVIEDKKISVLRIVSPIKNTYITIIV